MNKLLVTIAGRERTVEIEQRDGATVFHVDGEPREIEAVEVEPGMFSILLGGRSYVVRVQNAAEGYRAYIAGRAQPYEASVRDPRRRSRAALSGAGRKDITSPMPGKVVRVLVEEGQAVTAGQGLVVVEAMKMQNEIKSPKDGAVAKVLAEPGMTINGGEVLVVVE